MVRLTHFFALLQEHASPHKLLLHVTRLEYYHDGGRVRGEHGSKSFMFLSERRIRENGQSFGAKHEKARQKRFGVSLCLPVDEVGSGSCACMLRDESM
jgi:hypothetical protein